MSGATRGSDTGPTAAPLAQPPEPSPSAAPDETDTRLVPSMMDPGFYPEETCEVKLVQTHISYVFLVGEHVYKVKKPVDFGFLDFTSLERRRFYCLEEMRLNRRLAPDAYLAVLPILEVGPRHAGPAVPGSTQREDGPPCADDGPHGGGMAPGGVASGSGLVLGDADMSGSSSAAAAGSAAPGRAVAGGRVVEYALKMARLPEERMLKNLLARGQVWPEMMRAIARKVAAFHAEADTGGEVDAIGGPASVRHNSWENFQQTEHYIGLTIPAWQHRFLSLYDEQFFEAHRPLLERRVLEHRVRDCHGDLHLEHICFTGTGSAVGADDITIFDCIEFNKRFRYGDVGLEVAFLAMDLEFNGYDELAQEFVAAYVESSEDSDLPSLLNFFACYRAYVRGKVVGFRLDDPALSADDRAATAGTASRYFDLAFRYAARLEGPTLLLVGGLMGTGKSVLSRGMAGLLGAEVLQMDVIRKELAGVPPGERHFEEFGAGLYSAETTALTYAEAVRRAVAMLQAGRSVIIDASWSRRADRLQAVAAAREAGVETVFIEARAAEQVVRRRLEQRLEQAGEPSDGRWEIYAAQKAAFEPVQEDEGARLVVVDCGVPPDRCAALAVCVVRVPGYHEP